MALLNVNLYGFKELEKRISTAVVKVPKEVDAELSISAQAMRGRAIMDAPADQGLIRAEVQVQQASFLNWNIFSNAIYSGYQEFGTRSKVSIPPGLEQVAAELKGGTISSLGAKEAIYAWCRRKGIEQDLWWPIFVSIMVTGIKPHPFFFKQLDIERPRLLKNLQNILDRI